MDITELNSMWAIDCKIDETNISRESSRIPELHNKYYMMYVKEGLKLKKLKSDYTVLEKEKTEYYNGTMDIAEVKRKGWEPNKLRLLKTDVPKYVEADKEIIELSLKIGYHDSIVKYLEDIIRQINNRNFILKNIVDWSKFTSGVN